MFCTLYNFTIWKIILFTCVDNRQFGSDTAEVIICCVVTFRPLTTYVTVWTTLETWQWVAFSVYTSCSRTCANMKILRVAALKRIKWSSELNKSVQVNCMNVPWIDILLIRFHQFCSRHLVFQNQLLKQFAKLIRCKWGNRKLYFFGLDGSLPRYIQSSRQVFALLK